MDMLETTNELTIPFTQYMRPNGRKVPQQFPCDQETYDKAQQLLELGLRFEAEVLMNDMCSFTIFDPMSDIGDVAIKLCMNGPKVPETVKALVIEYEHGK